MGRENPCWGAPRIHGELLKLGINVGESSVSKYMVRSRKPPSQTWRTFLQIHAKQLVSIDFFTVPTIRFQRARPFPLTNFRATCYVTAMRSLAMNFENRCETWASAKFCLHRAHLGSEPISNG
jgi:hypothetical protein